MALLKLGQLARDFSQAKSLSGITLEKLRKSAALRSLILDNNIEHFVSQS
jgi:hypothetical protein